MTNYIRFALFSGALASLVFTTGLISVSKVRARTPALPAALPASLAEVRARTPALPAALPAALRAVAPDSIASTSTYFSVRKDVRRCAWPVCGGYWVKRVNRSNTACADGHFSSECYVAEIDWNGSSQIEPTRAVLRGSVSTKFYRRFRSLGVFRVSETWEAASNNTPTGEFFRVRDRGVRCITHPCLTHHEAKLNSTISREIAGVELNHTGASDSRMSEAFEAMTGRDGILVSGTHHAVTGPGGRAQTLDASQFYLRAGGSTSMKPCIKTGCSGQICSDQEVVTTCEYRSEYECYKRAACERQANGDCGFTRTPELTACLRRR